MCELWERSRAVRRWLAAVVVWQVVWTTPLVYDWLVTQRFGLVLFVNVCVGAVATLWALGRLRGPSLRGRRFGRSRAGSSNSRSALKNETGGSDGS